MRSFAVIYYENGKICRDIFCAENMRMALKEFYENVSRGEYNVLTVSDITEICIDDCYIMNYDDVCRSLEEAQND